MAAGCHEMSGNTFQASLRLGPVWFSSDVWNMSILGNTNRTIIPNIYLGLGTKKEAYVKPPFLRIGPELNTNKNLQTMVKRLAWAWKPINLWSGHKILEELYLNRSLVAAKLWDKLEIIHKKFKLTHSIHIFNNYQNCMLYRKNKCMWIFSCVISTSFMHLTVSLYQWKMR